jgi:hypothetical protein
MVVASKVENPFRPGFGRPPLVVVGRRRIVERVTEAFDSDCHPARKTYFRALRGSGKTGLLNAVQDVATDRGWLVIEENAGARSQPLIERLQARLWQYVDEQHPAPKRRGTGSQIGIGPVSAGRSWETVDRPQLRTLRDDLEAVLALESGRPAGVLLSIDEIHEATRDDVHEIGNAIQHLERASRPVAVVLAGLPPVADDRQRQQPTFLTRCDLPTIDTVDDDEIRRGFVETAAIAGYQFTSEALAMAVQAAAGFPYMMQLVGWEAVAAASGPEIGRAEIVRAIPIAVEQLGQAVLIPTEARLSNTDRQFLAAMAIDNGPSRIAALIERLRQTKQYVNMYRTRLIAAGLVQQPARGLVDFVVPGHRAYLRSTTDIPELAQTIGQPLPRRP